MNATRLSTGLAGQLAAAGTTFLVLAVLWWGIADPLLDWYADRADTLSQRAVLLQHMDDLAATLPMLKRQAAAQPADQAARPDMLLQAASDATASAELQQRVQDMAMEAGVAVTSVETLTGHQDAALRQITLRVGATATWRPLVQLFAAIERGSPNMSIDDLQLRAGIDLQHTDDLPVTASFSVIAFRTGETP